MTIKIYIRDNDKIVTSVKRVSLKSSLEQTTFEKILTPDITNWLDSNCLRYSNILKELIKMDNCSYTLYDEITHLEFEKEDDAVLFKMVWV